MMYMYLWHNQWWMSLQTAINSDPQLVQAPLAIIWQISAGATSGLRGWQPALRTCLYCIRQEGCRQYLLPIIRQYHYALWWSLIPISSLHNLHIALQLYNTRATSSLPLPSSLSVQHPTVITAVLNLLLLSWRYSSPWIDSALCIAPHQWNPKIVVSKLSTRVPKSVCSCMFHIFCRLGHLSTQNPNPHGSPCTSESSCCVKEKGISLWLLDL